MESWFYQHMNIFAYTTSRSCGYTDKTHRLFTVRLQVKGYEIGYRSRHIHVR